MDWDRVRALSEDERDAAAREDVDNPLWTEEAFRDAEYVHPNGEPCVPFISYLPPHIMDHYTSAGEGYQERISQDLQQLLRAASTTEGASSQIGG